MTSPTDLRESQGHLVTNSWQASSPTLASASTSYDVLIKCSVGERGEGGTHGIDGAGILRATVEGENLEGTTKRLVEGKGTLQESKDGTASVRISTEAEETPMAQVRQSSTHKAEEGALDMRAGVFVARLGSLGHDRDGRLGSLGHDRYGGRKANRMGASLHRVLKNKGDEGEGNDASDGQGGSTQRKRGKGSSG